MGAYLGITGKYLGMIERGEKSVEDDTPLGILFRMLEESGAPSPPGQPPDDDPRTGGAIGETQDPATGSTMLREDPPILYRTRALKGQMRMVPVVSWAHAGTAESYEELPGSWQEQVATDCRDPKAFAVRLIGDSMEQRYVEGDVLILQPSNEIHSGCLAVVRLATDGVVFRRVELRKDTIRLVALNAQYGAEEISRDDVLWAYPLYGMWRQVWK